jgi:hypothetical protein
MTILALAATPLAARAAYAQGDLGGGDSRPAPLTVGIGLGTEVGAGSVTAPNQGSVRIVLAPNLQLDVRTAAVVVGGGPLPATTVPLGGFNLNHSSLSAEGAGKSTDLHKQNDVAIASDVRYVLASRGPVDLSAIGGLAYHYIGEDKEDIAGTDVTTHVITLEWGVGLSYYFAHVWSLSMDITNPLFTWFKTSTDTTAGSTSVSGFDLGINFNPTSRLMLHLFF